MSFYYDGVARNSKRQILAHHPHKLVSPNDARLKGTAPFAILGVITLASLVLCPFAAAALRHLGE